MSTTSAKERRRAAKGRPYAIIGHDFARYICEVYPNGCERDRRDRMHKALADYGFHFWPAIAGQPGKSYYVRISPADLNFQRGARWAQRLQAWLEGHLDVLCRGDAEAIRAAACMEAIVGHVDDMVDANGNRREGW